MSTNKDADQTDMANAADADMAETTVLPEDFIVAATGELVKMAAIAAGLAGLYVIWDEWIPALRILNEVTIGNTSLGHVALALLAVIFTGILARRCPADVDWTRVLGQSAPGLATLGRAVGVHSWRLQSKRVPAHARTGRPGR